MVVTPTSALQFVWMDLSIEQLQTPRFDPSLFNLSIIM